MAEEKTSKGEVTMPVEALEEIASTLRIEDRLQGAPDALFEDIEWRIDSAPYERGGGHVARWVPYLRAPSVARLLDEWVGAGAWTDRYIGAGKGLECHLTIHGITKIDIGVSPGGSDDMAVKGIYSDAFKRVASIKWGVGRNVYRLEGLWAPVRVVTKDGKEQAREITPDSMDSIRKQYEEMMEAGSGNPS